MPLTDSPERHGEGQSVLPFMYRLGDKQPAVSNIWPVFVYPVKGLFTLMRSSCLKAL